MSVPHAPDVVPDVRRAWAPVADLTAAAVMAVAQVVGGTVRVRGTVMSGGEISLSRKGGWALGLLTPVLSRGQVALAWRL